MNGVVLGKLDRSVPVNAPGTGYAVPWPRSRGAVHTLNIFHRKAEENFFIHGRDKYISPPANSNPCRQLKRFPGHIPSLRHHDFAALRGSFESKRNAYIWRKNNKSAGTISALRGK